MHIYIYICLLLGGTYRSVLRSPPHISYGGSAVGVGLVILVLMLGGPAANISLTAEVAP